MISFVSFVAIGRRCHSGTGGVRKVRWDAEGKGERSGFAVPGECRAMFFLCAHCGPRGAGSRDTVAV
jgi:hypothetical protein